MAATGTTTYESPTYLERILDLRSLLQKKSRFLFGPRQTGKTSLIRHSLEGVKSYDLLDTSVCLALGQNPDRIAQELTSRNRVVVIDEIQRLPVLLNEVHRLTEEPGIRFLITGSSAQKLHQGIDFFQHSSFSVPHSSPLVPRFTASIPRPEKSTPCEAKS